MRIARLVPALAAAGLVSVTAACSRPAHALWPAAAFGTVTGHLYGVGGPAPGLPLAWPGTVTVTGDGFRRDVIVGTGGTFSIAVPVGRYTVVGHSPRYGGGTALCQAAGKATVTRGHSTTADVLCQMS
jgi:hypothetical protein